MEGSDSFNASAAYRLDGGVTAESPIFLPLPGGNHDLSSMMQFCRRVAPGASMIVADFLRLHAETGAGNMPSTRLMSDRLAAVITEAVSAHDLSLLPVIVVGNAEGADLGVCLGLAHGPLLGACILLRPKAKARLIRPRALDGVHVLLVQSLAEKGETRLAPNLGGVLKRAGAEIICEQTPDGEGLGQAETAMAHVFVEVLFGA